MVPLRVHDAEHVRLLLSDYLSSVGFGFRFENGRLTGITKRGEYSKTGQMKKAAEWFRVPYSTLHRLAHGKAAHISWSAEFAIEKRLLDRDPEFWAKLQPALVGPRTRRILAYYTGAIEQAIQWDRKQSSVTWNYYFEHEDPELAKLDALIKRLGLPATRWDLARRRAVAPILSWPALKKRSHKQRPALLKWAIRFECELVHEEARILRALLHESELRGPRPPHPKPIAERTTS